MASRTTSRPASLLATSQSRTRATAPLITRPAQRPKRGMLGWTTAVLLMAGLRGDGLRMILPEGRASGGGDDSRVEKLSSATSRRRVGLAAAPGSERLDPWAAATD